ncbi:MAG: hypothetical protein CMJ51_00745 [Planctomycetaceae bacterium]|nr:hypothetical protein [Planctomycetaceae bacterium]
MSRENRSPKFLRRTGAIMIAVVLGLGVGASKIPDLLRPAQTTYVATLPLSHGASGIAAGSSVEIGGLPQGRVILIKDQIASKKQLIEIHFELDRRFVLSSDALIRLRVGIAGTNGVLNIRDQGTKKSRFQPGEPRVIAVSLSEPSGGSAGVLLGRTNGLLIEKIATLTDDANTAISTRVQLTSLLVSAILDRIEAFVQMTRPDLVVIQDELKALRTQFSKILARQPLAERAIESLQTAAETDTAHVRKELLRIRDRFDLIDIDVRAMQGDMGEIIDEASDMRARVIAAGSDLESALNDLNSIATRFKIHAPEFRDGIARMLARLVLAGGQLKLALNDLFPIVLEAITTHPDRASESRRLLREAVDDTVLAGIDLRDAARRLERLERLHRNGEDPGAAPIPSLEDVVTRFEKMVDALAERLRREIIDGS